MLEMLQMGKYGAYVWSSYGLALVLMSYVAIKPLMDKKSIFKELMMKYRRDAHNEEK
ncbi:MAG: heme exporter protein CcmD [gamma proteobacterium symbiont of Bathyaustriella thionipta]|nr:heme exporter protein CcmD [gamma proteobacterium symbiont of Bathyaustriella thionipta]MCU7950294.1 heme exporter protein CcmD [gamma proteobacterium symbiont of Bathyaustriella thionipta]MCU7954443.1 heme exporter protein CcmD [gamma proteobacterium symbiont of Bathyaustriella thionipta]MCU7956808.1 heme exporter protein CcmD [gamma proteobacterium symbiont of Bathyaustriella thionipta]MCU7968656.1 heme exporter protein CcmD [gamma proteobacterium symbiont of Bathyaustriella thionipta]